MAGIGVRMRKKINPKQWVVTANARRPKLPHTTDWFDGTTAPTRPGWYERHFTDSMIDDGAGSMQWWDGAHWYTAPSGLRHWRQVGDYPAWRGKLRPNPPLHDNEFALAA